MPHTLSALVGLVLMVSCVCDAAAAQSGSRWWHFGRRDAAASQKPDIAESAAQATDQDIYTATEPTLPDDEPAQRWMIDSPLAKVSWPRFQFPDVPKPHLPRPELWPKKSDVASRNAWAEPDPSVKPTSPLQAMANGARRVGDSTRAAWDKTIDVLIPMEDSHEASSRIARREARPSMWQRMLGAEEDQQQGPRTVTEWMAQDRID